MTSFSGLFRKRNPQPLGLGPLHPEHTLFRAPAPTIRTESFGSSASAATDPPAAGNGASPVSNFGPAALDFDMLDCEMHHAVAALIGANEVY